MRPKMPRLAARAVIVADNSLLLVNAYGGGVSQLWCAPGGGVESGSSLPDNLAREVFEECGLSVEIGAPCLINEFHDPARGFHQVEIFFRAEITTGQISDAWQDPEAVVTTRRFFSPSELESLHLRPRSLPEVAFSQADAVKYDPLERIVI